MKEKIKVRSKDNKQFILKKDGTWFRVINFKKGDSVKFIKEWETTGGTIRVGDIFIIDSVWVNNKKNDGVYWIKCLNRQRNVSDRREGQDWIMGVSLMDFNDDLDELFIKWTPRSVSPVQVISKDT